MNCPAMPGGGGRGMKCRKPFRPITRKITPARYRAITEAVFITWFSLSTGAFCIGAIHIDINIIDDDILRRDSGFYGSRQPKDGPRLASNDEGDAHPDQVRNRWD